MTQIFYDMVTGKNKLRNEKSVIIKIIILIIIIMIVMIKSDSKNEWECSKVRTACQFHSSPKRQT